MSTTAPPALSRIRDLVEPALRAAVDRLEDDSMRLVASYQLGWCDRSGNPVAGGGGKAVRPALAVLSATAAGGDEEDGVPGAVAVELIHNFSLLHDDVMDRDTERRHRATGWVAFGASPAILAGTAMLTLACEVLTDRCDPAVLGCVLSATQRLISGQADDLRFEQGGPVGFDDVLRMEAGKTAALLGCASSIGARAVGAPAQTVDALERYGFHLGLSFQLVDDLLGIVGDPAVTGKSASSDLRAGKRSAPIVAALTSGTEAGTRLTDLLADGPPASDEDVSLAAKLVAEAGGLARTEQAAADHLATALDALQSAPLVPGPAAELADVARFVVNRDR
jgi:geranylgeranyl diphosphate synthase type I